MLNELKSCLDLPVNFKPRMGSDNQNTRGSRMARDHQKIPKNEEYYLDNYAVEIVSALLKMIVEGLVRTQSINAVEQIPFSISRLLYLASNRSDQPVEREIFEQFCFESNKVMVDEIAHFKDKVVTFEKI